MTEELQPGRELDAAVAERIMGFRREKVPPDCNGLHGGTDVLVPPTIKPGSWHYPGVGPIALTYFVPRYSTEIASAWLVAEKLGLGIIKVDYGWMAFLDDGRGYTDDLTIDVRLDASSTANTAPHAISLCALKAAALPEAAPPPTS
jgi:Phage ABA sandwich domain